MGGLLGRKGTLFFYRSGHSVGASLADFFVVAEDGAKAALDVVFESGDGNYVEVAAGFEAVPGIA